MTTPRKILRRDFDADYCCVCHRPMERPGLPREEIIRELRDCQVRMHIGPCSDKYESHHGTIENPVRFFSAQEIRRRHEQ